jgi:folate-dependent phosphoribosylglycinamide formyltransferase PurN
MIDFKQYKICLLGMYDELYTKMMMIELDNRKINYDIILVKNKKAFEAKSMIQRIYDFMLLINSERFKNLSKYTCYFWKKVIELKMFERSKTNYLLFKDYLQVNFDEILKNKTVYFIKDINSAELYILLKEKKYDFGILGYVDIISQPIIDCFKRYILNAHPAPLPECRGAGELIFTFYYNLIPAVSIHIVTAKIDAGNILRKEELKLSKKDTYYSIRAKLTILRCVLMSKLIKDIIDNKPIKSVENNGKLHQWKDCTVVVQKTADNRLRNIKKNLDYV